MLYVPHRHSGLQLYTGPTLKGAIEKLGLATNLELVLDAGDIASVASASQASWLDASGNGFDFFRGTTGSAEGSDPTHNGTVNGRSATEYYSTDGGDSFRYDTTNETWMQNLHKDNAKFLATMFVRTPSGFGGVANALMGTSAISSPNIGFSWHVGAGGTLTFRVSKADGANFAVDRSSTSALSTSTDYMLGLSVDEANSVGYFRVNTSYFQVSGSDTFNAAYTSPSASNATNTMEICAAGNASFRMATGWRIYGVAMWEGSSIPAVASLDALWNAMRGRFNT